MLFLSFSFECSTLSQFSTSTTVHPHNFSAFFVIPLMFSRFLTCTIQNSLLIYSSQHLTTFLWLPFPTCPLLFFSSIPRPPSPKSPLLTHPLYPTLLPLRPPILYSPVNSKQQCEGCHGLLSTRQVVHGSESLSWSHAVVVDAVQVGLLRVLGAQESLRTGVLSESLQRKIEGDW